MCLNNALDGDQAIALPTSADGQQDDTLSSDAQCEI